MKSKEGLVAAIIVSTLITVGGVWFALKKGSERAGVVIGDVETRYLSVNLDDISIDSAMEKLDMALIHVSYLYVKSVKAEGVTDSEDQKSLEDASALLRKAIRDLAAVRSHKK